MLSRSRHRTARGTLDGGRTVATFTSTSTHDSELPDAGAGSDPFRLSKAAADEAGDAFVAAVLPEPRERAADEWSTPADRPVFEDVPDAVVNLDGAELRATSRELDGRVFRISSI